VVGSLYLVLGKSSRLVANTCKRSFLVDVGNLKSVSMYFLRERKYNNIIERYSENIYAIKNKDYEPLS